MKKHFVLFLLLSAIIPVTQHAQVQTNKHVAGQALDLALHCSNYTEYTYHIAVYSYSTDQTYYFDAAPGQSIIGNIPAGYCSVSFSSDDTGSRYYIAGCGNYTTGNGSGSINGVEMSENCSGLIIG